MRDAYGAAVGSWGISPRDFWSLHPDEFWWISAAKKPVKTYGKMTEAEVEEIYEDELEHHKPEARNIAAQKRREYQAALESGDDALIARMRKERGMEPGEKQALLPDWQVPQPQRVQIRRRTPVIHTPPE